jgi:peptidylprolyl isomerase
MVTDGNTIKVHYTGKLGDGSVFDSSDGRQPLQFTVGQGEVIQGFDKTVIGMKIGDAKTFTIPFMEAYGPYHKEMVIVLKRGQFPPELNPQVGQHLQMSKPDGDAIPVIVTAVSDDSLTLDANHPLAGKNLTFEIKLVEVA